MLPKNIWKKDYKGSEIYLNFNHIILFNLNNIIWQQHYLENHNKYSYLGLRRRPTYNEIINLIGENETLTGQLPDRTATQFKASQEGSFFDGLDHLEILKEQQHRIQERQMRELLLRQNLGGRTYHLERMRQQGRENTPPEPETPSEDSMADAQMQTELERRAREYSDRQQQTGQAHQGLLSRNASSIMDSLFGGFSPLSRAGSRPQTPALQMPQPKREQREPEVTNIASDVEDVSSGEMMTVREEVPTFTDKKQETIYYSLRAGNPDVSKNDLDEAFEILDRFKNKTSGTLARNFTEINEIYQTLFRTGFVSESVFSDFLKLVERLNSTKGHANKEEVRNEIGRHYAEHIYNKYIADIARRAAAQTKARARAKRKDTGARSSKG